MKTGSGVREMIPISSKEDYKWVDYGIYLTQTELYRKQEQMLREYCEKWLKENNSTKYLKLNKNIRVL